MEYVLYHSGVKGMKWGVRRYQNKDGSLTPAGQKRYNTMKSASAKAKDFSEMAREDSEKFTKKAEQAKNRKLSKSQWEKAMDEMFGYTDEKYYESEAKEFGYADTHQAARDWLKIGQEGYEYYKSISDGARKVADFYERLSDSYKNASVASLNKKTIKKAEKFIKDGYLNDLDYPDWQLKYDKERYGI